MDIWDSLPYYVKVIVIGFGFMSGFWIAVGVNPETELIKAFADVLNSIKSGWGIFFWLIPIVGFFVSIYIMWALGGWLGSLGTFIAFIGGLVIMCSPLWGIALGGIGAVLGFFASQEQ